MSALSSPDTAKGQLQRIALDYLREKEAAGEIPTSIRFVFYELEQRGLQTKAQTSKRKPAQNLTDAITVLRDVGLIPWDWIVDDGRRQLGGVAVTRPSLTATSAPIWVSRRCVVPSA